MFKAWNVKLPVNIQSLFKLNKENKYASRKCFDFKVNYCKSKIKPNCISILAVKLWNMLDNKLKNSNTVLSFLKKG